MKINPNSEIPIFIQIAQQLEDAICIGIYAEESQILSTNELSVLLQINPHTVLKGMNLLVEEGFLYKKRGIGLFVKEGSVAKIREKRKSQFYSQFILTMVKEAKKLDITKEELFESIERGYQDESNSN